jgi:hypothetical protein
MLDPSELPKAKNVLPSYGGALVLYTSAETLAGKRLVFVNGIANSPTDHRKACERLCGLTNCEVLGVYNQTGLTADFASGETRNTLEKLFDGTFDFGQAIADDLGSLVRRIVQGRTGILNGCTASLLALLLAEGARWPNYPLCIVAHSQGNLIVSNALMRYTRLVTRNKLVPPQIHVLAVASPSLVWPPRRHAYIRVDRFYHCADPVRIVGNNWVGIKKERSTMTANSAKHSFESYLNDELFIRALRDSLGQSRRLAPFPDRGQGGPAPDDPSAAPTAPGGCAGSFSPRAHPRWDGVGTLAPSPAHR